MVQDVNLTRQLVIRPLQQESITAAARLLACSMRDNPLHQRVFASDDARLEPLLAHAFVRLLRRQMRTGCVFGAYASNVLVGVAAMVPPGHCQPSLKEKLAMLSILARGRTLRRLPRIRHWLRAWARHDPEFDHWHLGPAAVDRARQGQGIGSQLMVTICDQLDRHRGIGYLETDKPENVRLYRRGGFEVVAEQPALGVTNWFMLRRKNGAKNGARNGARFTYRPPVVVGNEPDPVRTPFRAPFRRTCSFCFTPSPQTVLSLGGKAVLITRHWRVHG